MNAYVKGGIVAVLIAIGIVWWYQANVNKLPVNQSPAEFKIIDQMESVGVPDFTLERIDGSPFKLADLKGKVVVVNFWASWCNPCVEEFPSMVKLVDRMKDDVVVVAISTDDKKEDILPFLKAFGVPRPGFEVVWDKDKKVMEQYGIKKIPESFIVGRDFKLVRKVLGVEDWAGEGAIGFFQAVKDGKDPSRPH